MSATVNPHQRGSRAAHAAKAAILARIEAREYRETVALLAALVGPVRVNRPDSRP